MLWAPRQGYTCIEVTLRSDQLEIHLRHRRVGEIRGDCELVRGTAKGGERVYHTFPLFRVSGEKSVFNLRDRNCIKGQSVGPPRSILLWSLPPGRSTIRF
jgi:hypothetical protein